MMAENANPSDRAEALEEGQVVPDWIVEITPEPSSKMTGKLFGNTGVFGIDVEGGSTETFFEYTYDGGKTWFPVPNNSWRGFKAVDVKESLYRINPKGERVVARLGRPS
jgi:hypothetical protein